MKSFFKNLFMALAVVAAISALFLGLHVTFVQMFYGGLVDMVTGASASPIDALLITKGATKFLLCYIPGIVTGLGVFLISSGLFAIGCWLDD